MKIAPLKFAFGIHLFVTKDTQVLRFGKGDELLVGEQPVAFQLNVGGPAFARCSVPSCRVKRKKMNRVKSSS